MERQNFSFKVKSLDDAGSFVGLGAAYNNVDLGNDKILPGAFSRTLAGAKRLPLLWQHNPADPIGSVTCTETSQGLEVQGQLLLSDATGQKAYNLLKNGILKGLSIGFESIQESFEGSIRLLKEIRLWEVSIVTFPMNEAAAVTSIKSMSDADRSRHLKAINEHRKAIDRHQRGIREHLKSMLDDAELDESDLNPADDPSLLEGNEGDNQGPSYEGMAWLVGELKALSVEAADLAPDI